MITKRELKILKLKVSRIEQYVIDVLLDRYDDYNDIEEYIKEIFYYGCANGTVCSLVYYHDTIAFYETHKHKINEYLYNTMKEISEYDLSKIFPKWNDEDPLALDIPNRNLLAWFGFEKALQDLCMDLNITL